MKHIIVTAALGLSVLAGATSAAEAGTFDVWRYPLPNTTQFKPYKQCDNIVANSLALAAVACEKDRGGLMTRASYVSKRWAAKQPFTTFKVETQVAGQTSGTYSGWFCNYRYRELNGCRNP